jgi:hypothetical protein
MTMRHVDSNLDQVIFFFFNISGLADPEDSYLLESLDPDPNSGLILNQVFKL